MLLHLEQNILRRVTQLHARRHLVHVLPARAARMDERLLDPRRIAPERRQVRPQILGGKRAHPPGLSPFPISPFRSLNGSTCTITSRTCGNSRCNWAFTSCDNRCPSSTEISGSTSTCKSTMRRIQTLSTPLIPGQARLVSQINSRSDGSTEPSINSCSAGPSSHSPVLISQ